MHVSATALAIVLLGGGGACVYLTLPNQRLLPAHLPPGKRAAGWACLIGSLAVLLCLMGPATAVFTWTIGLMAVWTMLPIAIAWLRHRKDTRV